ncbi:Pirin-like protein [Pandoraea terrae]|uniref:Pirin-like protein n=1 Tax=Pandoraea terrae TaxID=1537710 RepID=A0A5E4XNC4_9BURK|nr:pirin-like C-terminal cupin domain-containing protein [Pandoraea terrae]VVE38011.1 Pirin-like protein [Pandoraea terrae]
MADTQRLRRRPAPAAKGPAKPRVLPVTRPGRCAAVAGAGVFDQLTETDPFLSIDAFRRHGASIPPHPHAGCAVAIYPLPDTGTALRSRNAHGGDDIVRPGDLLWLDANCGTVHEDVPVTRDAECRGLRLIVNRPGRHRAGPPSQCVVPREHMPVWREGAVDLTLVCGRWQARQSLLEPSAATSLLLLTWQGDGALTLPLAADGRRWFALILDASAAIGGVALTAGGEAEALMLPSGQWQATGRTGTRIALVGGEPVNEPVVFRGNFAARNEGELVDVLRHYQQGAMGVMCMQGHDGTH